MASSEMEIFSASAIKRIRSAIFAACGARRLVQRGARCWRRLVRLVTIERFSHQPRGRGFPNAARAGKQISVMQPAVLDRVAQRLGQDFLPGYVFEFLRAPLAR